MLTTACSCYRSVALFFVCGLVASSLAGCRDRAKELEKQYGLDVPGNPYVDYSLDLRAALGSLRNGNTADAEEQLSAYTAADFPGGEEIFTEMKSKLDVLAGKTPAGEGGKPTVSEVQALLKKLIDLDKTKRAEATVKE